MDLQSRQCQRCRAGAVGPLLNPSMAWGCHVLGVDVQQDSSELVVKRRLSQCRLFLRAAASLGASLRGTGLIRPCRGTVVPHGELEEVRQDQVLLREQPTLVVGPAALGTVQQLHQPWGNADHAPEPGTGALS